MHVLSGYDANTFLLNYFISLQNANRRYFALLVKNNLEANINYLILAVRKVKHTHKMVLSLEVTSCLLYNIHRSF